MSSRTQWILAVALVIGALAVGALLVGGGGIAVEVAPAVRGPFSVAVHEEGRTRVRDRYLITAPSTGRLSRVTVEPGDTIVRGQTVARLAPSPEDPRMVEMIHQEVAAAEARLAEARAALRDAEGSAEQALREAERRRPLLEMGAISEERFERAERAAATAEARLEAARAAVDAVTSALGAARARLLGSEDLESSPTVPVTTPVPGMVLRVLRESEGVVAAGTPLVEVSDTTGLEIVVDLLTEEAVRVEPGDSMIVTDWGGEAELAGRVRTVEPEAFTEISSLGVEEQRVNVVGDLAHRPAGLGAGYRVEVAVVVWSAPSVLTIPTSALFRVGDEWRVFALDGGRARAVPVEVGHQGVQRVEIVGGLDEGDRVVVFPSDEVTDGARVRASPAAASEGGG